MKVINLSEQNSVLNTFLAELRDVHIQHDSMRFRRNLERLGEVMAVEVSRELHYSVRKVTTPLGVADIRSIDDSMVLGTILRAGLPLHQGFLNIFDHAENAFISAYRRQNAQGELEIVAEYLAAPKLDGKTLLLVDPMLATGMSMEVAYQSLLSHGQPAHVHLCSVIAAPEAVDYLQRMMPADVTLWCAVIDERLNAMKYIVPGLGDAGDLSFGSKL